MVEEIEEDAPGSRAWSLFLHGECLYIPYFPFTFTCQCSHPLVV